MLLKKGFDPVVVEGIGVIFQPDTPGGPPPYGAGGHTLVLKNYYYLYSFISPTRCTLWAIPVGARAKEAPSYFLVIAPTERKKFKGPALDLKQASTITGEPTYTQLAMLGMIQQNDPPPKR